MSRPVLSAPARTVGAVPLRIPRVVAVLSLVLATATVSPASALAADVYTAPLRTAVRQLPVAPEANAGSSRTRFFGEWLDADGDCLNTRHEVLLAESTVPVRMTSGGCTVAAGRWVSAYDRTVASSPAQLEVDHVVPVAEAWGSGARAWTQARRIAFYNDLGVGASLAAVPRALNQDKQADGPEAWLPPTNRCAYVQAWTAVKHRWRLSVDRVERGALLRYADLCPPLTVTVPRA